MSSIHDFFSITELKDILVLQNNRSGSCVGLRSLVWVLAGVVAVMACGLVPAGCSVQSCNDNQSALPLMGFYSSATQRPIILDSIDMGGVGAPHDSLLVHAGQSVSSLYLPFRFENDATSFFIHYAYRESGLDNPAFNDTIVFRYRAIHISLRRSAEPTISMWSGRWSTHAI